MATYFLDSSGLVKRYVNESGTTWIREIADPASLNIIYIARITGAETISAIIRCKRRGIISPVQTTLAVADFRHHYTVAYIPVEITSVLMSRAMNLAEIHGLRGYDAVQLAAALQVQTERLNAGVPGLTFISADQNLNTAAAAESLTVDDPNQHP